MEYLPDRARSIGHAYVMNAQTLDDLRRILRVQLIPLLQEYFFDDLSRVAMVLASAPAAPPFIDTQKLSYDALFSASRGEGVPVERRRYVVTPEGSWTEESFRGIYESVGAETESGETV